MQAILNAVFASRIRQTNRGSRPSGRRAGGSAITEESTRPAPCRKDSM